MIDSIRSDPIRSDSIRLRSNCRQFASYPPSGFIVDVGIGEDLQRQARQPPNAKPSTALTRAVNGLLRAVGSEELSFLVRSDSLRHRYSAGVGCMRRLLHFAALPSGPTNGNAIDRLLALVRSANCTRSASSTQRRGCSSSTLRCAHGHCHCHCHSHCCTKRSARHGNTLLNGLV